MTPADLLRLRVASAVDVHPYASGRRLVLAGVEVPHSHGLAGHSDADVVAHAVTDAVLGACGSSDDIGTLYPPDELAWQDADSLELLRGAWEPWTGQGWQLVSVDVTIVAEAPRLAEHRDSMRENLANTLGMAADRVSMRATSTDGQGFVGRGEGVAALATVLALAPSA